MNPENLPVVLFFAPLVTAFRQEWHFTNRLPNIVKGDLLRHLSVLPISPRCHAHQFANTPLFLKNFRMGMFRYAIVRLHKFCYVLFRNYAHNILFVAETPIPQPARIHSIYWLCVAKTVDCTLALCKVYRCGTKPLESRS